MRDVWTIAAGTVAVASFIALLLAGALGSGGVMVVASVVFAISAVAALVLAGW